MSDQAQSEPQHQSQREPGRNLTDCEMARWREYFEAHVEQSISAEHELIIEVVSQALGEERIRQREEVDAKFKQVPPGPRGEPGPTGKLPLVKAYRPDAVHYAGDVVVHRGGTVGTVKSRTFRARARLVEIMGLACPQDLGPDRGTQAALTGGNLRWAA